MGGGRRRLDIPMGVMKNQEEGTRFIALRDKFLNVTPKHLEWLLNGLSEMVVLKTIE